MESNDFFCLGFFVLKKQLLKGDSYICHIYYFGAELHQFPHGGTNWLKVRHKDDMQNPVNFQNKTPLTWFGH